MTDIVICQKCDKTLSKPQAIHSLVHHSRLPFGNTWDAYHCMTCAKKACKQCICWPEHAVPEEEHYIRANHPWVPLIEEQPIPIVEEKKVPKSKTPIADIFGSTYSHTIESVFKTLVPKEKTMTFSLLQALYSDNPSRFRLISNIHQNSFEDKLHLSLAVNCGKSSYTLHVYGYWKNHFRVGAVTMKDDDNIHTIATF